MNLAILCNTISEKKTDRIELVNSLNAKGIKVFICGIKGEYFNEYYCDETANFIPIIASRDNTNPIKEIKSIISVKNKIKEYKIDIVIIYGVKNHAAMTIGSKLGGARKIMCIVNGRGNLFLLKGWKGFLIRRLAFPMLKIAYRLSNSICFQNEDDLSLFLNRRLISKKQKKFVTNGSGVNLNKFYFQELPDEDNFLFLSRITPSKGLKEFVLASRSVKEKYPKANFDIVGQIDGKVEKNNLIGFLQEAITDGIVKYHGKTNNVPSWMGKCRYFVYPSYYPEGVPRVAIQALATGRPIITCDSTGCKETVIDGINGFKVMPRNERELADKMIWMIENPIETQKMARASRLIAEQKFDVERINDTICKYILEE